jgi:hypothetical protein
MWFITQQYFISLNHCKSLKPYKNVQISHNPSPQNHHYSLGTTSNLNLFHNFSIRGTLLYFTLHPPGTPQKIFNPSALLFLASYYRKCVQIQCARLPGKLNFTHLNLIFVAFPLQNLLHVMSRILSWLQDFWKIHEHTHYSQTPIQHHKSL